MKIIVIDNPGLDRMARKFYPHLLPVYGRQIILEQLASRFTVRLI